MAKLKFNIFIVGLLLFTITVIACAQQGQQDEFSIEVNSTKVIKKISRDLFGFNIEWIENGNLVWDEQADDFNHCLVEQMELLKPGILRFPGGIFSDFYHWKNGVGEINKRPKSQAHIIDTRIFTNNFGTDEFIRLCKLLNAQALMTVNVGNGTKEEAADWVKYCNIDKKTEERVKFWELGNELYINTDAANKSVSIGPKEYAKRVKDYSLAMKVVDPDIKIVAIGGANTGFYTINQYKDWDKIVLKEAGQYVDYFAVHNAYYPLAVNPKDYSKEDVYRSLLGANLLIQENLKVLDKEIEESGFPGIKIAVTEWGPLFAWTHDSPYLEDTRTMGSALFIALALKTFIMSERVQIANLFKISGSDFMAFLKCGEVFPSFYAFNFFSNGFGNQLLETKCVSSTYNVDKRIGLIGKLKNIPLIEAISSTDDKNVLYLIVVNKDIKNGHTVKLIINNSKKNYKGTVTILSSVSVDSKIPILKEENIVINGEKDFYLPAHSLVKFVLKNR